MHKRKRQRLTTSEETKVETLRDYCGFTLSATVWYVPYPIPGSTFGGLVKRETLPVFIESVGQPTMLGEQVGVSFVYDQAVHPPLPTFILFSNYPLREWEQYLQTVEDDPLVARIVFEMLEQEVIHAGSIPQLGWSRTFPIKVKKKFPLQSTSYVYFHKQGSTGTSWTSWVENGCLLVSLDQHAIRFCNRQIATLQDCLHFAAIPPPLVRIMIQYAGSFLSLQ